MRRDGTHDLEWVGPIKHRGRYFRHLSITVLPREGVYHSVTPVFGTVIIAVGRPVSSCLDLLPSVPGQRIVARNQSQSTPSQYLKYRIPLMSTDTTVLVLGTLVFRIITLP